MKSTFLLKKYLNLIKMDVDSQTTMEQVKKLLHIGFEPVNLVFYIFYNICCPDLV